MLIVLRFIGVMNAAIWLGGVFLLTFAVGPAFSSLDMARILPETHIGAVAQVVRDRYFVFQYLCGVIAIGHLVMEWLYAGKPLGRWVLYLGIVLFGLVLANGMGMQPKLKRLHLDLYGVRSTPQQRQQAAISLRSLQAVTQFVNFLVLVGLLVYVWEITSPGTAPRFLSGPKFRG